MPKKIYTEMKARKYHSIYLGIKKIKFLFFFVFLDKLMPAAR
jgi:hypothetical protein